MSATAEKVYRGLKSYQKINHRGDVRIDGSIGANCNIVINDGTLVINGSVGSYSDIKLNGRSKLYLLGSIGSNVSIKGYKADMVFHGSIGSYASIDSNDGNIEAQSIGSNVNIKTTNGDIKVSNVGSYSELKSSNGNIVTDSIGSNCTLKTANGDITASTVGSYSTVKTTNGDIIITRSASSTANIESINGTADVAGRRHKPSAPSSSSGRFDMNIGGVTITGGTTTVSSGANLSIINGRVYLNGVERPDLARRMGYSTQVLGNIQMFSGVSFSDSQSSSSSSTSSDSDSGSSSNSDSEPEAILTGYRLHSEPEAEQNLASPEDELKLKYELHLAKFSAGTQSYIKRFQCKDSLSNKQRLAELEVEYKRCFNREIDVPDKFCCGIAFEIMDIPVSLNEEYYDLENITKWVLDKKQDLSREPATLVEINRANKLNNEIQEFFDCIIAEIKSVSDKVDGTPKPG